MCFLSFLLLLLPRLHYRLLTLCPAPTDPVGQSWPRGIGSAGDSVGVGYYSVVHIAVLLQCETPSWCLLRRSLFLLICARALLPLSCSESYVDLYVGATVPAFVRPGCVVNRDNVLIESA